MHGTSSTSPAVSVVARGPTVRSAAAALSGATSGNPSIGTARRAKLIKSMSEYVDDVPGEIVLAKVRDSEKKNKLRLKLSN